ncbi:uncharacterized protein RCC_12286 [Ramularia collo-cygni]|uniref:Azaphilone pigments biosynthesis cluster protein L N-terminal domain-containing protein n=1 Tax=Ramularia collo-cygni TaxID=112498 RepID=A0A2D3UMB6_9PEZI|nr:uncharacterized protein RCC_12286 [Ramularia collo-cygni]CZT15071.1 uncharacterized protein RCC_12286 [Ramularia collo-cygni]
MAEIFGTAASVVQVAEAGLSLATTLYTYAQSVKGAEEDIKRVARDVKLLAKVLQQLHQQIQGNGRVQTCTEEAVHDLEEVLVGCKEAFGEVNEVFIKSHSGRSTLSMTDKLKWPLRSNKLAALRANLEKLNTTLLLILSVLAYGTRMSQERGATVDFKPDLTLEKLQIQNLMQAKQEAMQRHEELDKAISKIPDVSNGEARVASASSDAIPSGVRVKGLAQGKGENREQPSSSTDKLTLLALPPEDQLHPIQTQIAKNVEPQDGVSCQLGRCTFKVRALTDIINLATTQWESHRVLDYEPISFCLDGSVKAIEALKPVEKDASEKDASESERNRALSSSTWMSMAEIDPDDISEVLNSQAVWSTSRALSTTDSSIMATSTLQSDHVPAVRTNRRDNLELQRRNQPEAFSRASNGFPKTPIIQAEKGTGLSPSVGTVHPLSEPRRVANIRRSSLLSTFRNRTTSMTPTSLQQDLSRDEVAPESAGNRHASLGSKEREGDPQDIWVAPRQQMESVGIMPRGNESIDDEDVAVAGLLRRWVKVVA